jgi:hypothetical protein
MPGQSLRSAVPPLTHQSQGLCLQVQVCDQLCLLSLFNPKGFVCKCSHVISFAISCAFSCAYIHPPIPRALSASAGMWSAVPIVTFQSLGFVCKCSHVFSFSISCATIPKGFCLQVQVWWSAVPIFTHQSQGFVCKCRYVISCAYCHPPVVTDLSASAGTGMRSAEQSAVPLNWHPPTLRVCKCRYLISCAYCHPPIPRALFANSVILSAIRSVVCSAVPVVTHQSQMICLQVQVCDQMIDQLCYQLCDQLYLLSPNSLTLKGLPVVCKCRYAIR